MNLRQGNTYLLKIALIDEDSNQIDISAVDMVELMLGEKRIVYPTDSVISYDASDKCFVVELTQEDTFGMNHYVESQARVKFVGGTVKGSEIISYHIARAISGEVL